MEQPNSIVHLAHVTVRDRDYNVAVSQNRITGCIHIFKYNDQCCDYCICNTADEAYQFLEKPLIL
jgi:hypothetical protein